MTYHSLTFFFADNADDVHGFTVSSEDHKAIFHDSFEFGDSVECVKNDWNTAVSLNADYTNYQRVAGNIMKTVYNPHGEDGSTCTMIDAVTVPVPAKFATVKLPTIADVDATGTKAVTTASFNVNFDDIDRDNVKENYNFEVTVTITADVSASGFVEFKPIA